MPRKILLQDPPSLPALDVLLLRLAAFGFSRALPHRCRPPKSSSSPLLSPRRVWRALLIFRLLILLHLRVISFRKAFLSRPSMVARLKPFCVISVTHSSVTKPISHFGLLRDANFYCRSSTRRCHAKTPPLPPLLFSSANRHRLVSICRKRIAFYPLPRASAGNPDGEYPQQAPEDIDEEAQAREAVVIVLQEHGVSSEEARDISLKCPHYIAQIVGSVRELDELSLWSSWQSSNASGVQQGEGSEPSGNSLTFKDKACHMVKQKKKNAILPFLESIGLGSSAGMRVASHLSSESLPDLIDRVNYLNSTFLSEGGQEMLIGRSARQIMTLLSVSVEDDIERTLSFFEKMESRRGGLDALGSADSSLACLIDSFPRLLLCSIEDHFKPLYNFFALIGIPKERTKNIVLLFPPVFFYDIERKVKPRLRALHKVGIEMKDYNRVLLKYPWILCRSIQDNYKEILNFFGTKKVPKASVERAIKGWPQLLGCSTSKMEIMLNQFRELGLRNKKLASVISSSPQLLLKKPNEFLQVVRFLEEFGFDEDAVFDILCRVPEVFNSNVEGTLKKKIKLLIEFGISPEGLPRVIKKYPELLVSDVRCNLLPRMVYLMKMGFSKKDVCSMVRRFSPLLGYSIDVVLKPKLEFLRVMEKPLAEVVEYPRYFSYCLEKKIKPRYMILKRRGIKCSLSEMLSMNNEEFAETYMGIERMLVFPPSHNDQ